jgi:TonB family protein
MPTFKGGNAALAKYIQMNMRVPADVREGSKAEKVFVKFIVDASGKVTDPVVLKASGYKSFDEEAIRIISGMPAWTAGIDKGNKVKVYMTLPISYKNAGVVNPEPVSEQHVNSMKYWNEGHKLEQQGKYDKALEKYSKSLEIEPGNNYALFDQGKMYLALGNKNKAREIWTGMIEKDVRKSEAESFINEYCGEQTDATKFSSFLKGSSFFSYGMEDVRGGRYEAALRKFDSCLKYRPDNKDALYNKGVMHHKLEQTKQACVTWNKLLQISPEDKGVEDLIKKNCN